jgi:hypothetical protein
MPERRFPPPWSERTKAKDSVVAHTNQQKRRTKAAPVLAAAGLSLSLASGASAAIGGMNPEINPAISAALAPQMMDEEEISEVSLATFHVLDRESAGTLRPTKVSQGACGIGFYYPQTQPASGELYQSPPQPRPRPIRPAHKYKRS